MPSFKILGLTCHHTGNAVAARIARNIREESELTGVAVNPLSVVEQLADVLDECLCALAGIADKAEIDGEKITPAGLQLLLDDQYKITKAR